VPAVGLVFQIPPGGKGVFPRAFCFGAEPATTIKVALAQFAEARAAAQRCDDALRASGLGEDARRKVSLTTRRFVAASRFTADRRIRLDASTSPGLIATA
jgi:hypothetical protein